MLMAAAGMAVAQSASPALRHRNEDDDAQWLYGASYCRYGRTHGQHGGQRAPCTTHWSICRPARACRARPSNCTLMPGNHAFAATISRALPARALAAIRTTLPSCDASKGKSTSSRACSGATVCTLIYDLLANPNLPSGISIPIGPTACADRLTAVAAGEAVAGDVQHRAPDDGHEPDAEAASTYSAYRFAYSQSTMEGPSLQPAPTRILKYNALLRQYQRNGSDDYTGALDWKPSHVNQDQL